LITSLVAIRRKINIMSTQVVHDSDNHRFEIFLDSSRVGLMDYVVKDDEIHLVHTEVNPEHQGKNLAAILVRESLQEIRDGGDKKVVPVCSYVVRYMEKHPETHDLLKGSIEEAVASCRWPGAN
jgi:hypothetical protein